MSLERLSSYASLTTAIRHSSFGFRFKELTSLFRADALELMMRTDNADGFQVVIEI